MDIRSFFGMPRMFGPMGLNPMLLAMNQHPQVVLNSLMGQPAASAPSASTESSAQDGLAGSHGCIQTEGLLCAAVCVVGL